MEIVFSLNEIHVAAKQLLGQSPAKVILFNGEMGAGKTTFIKELSKILGVAAPTSSPTFSLVNEYLSETGELIYHFDVYRLKNETEALDMGIEEYLYSGDWCFIEWAEKIPNLIPKEHTSVNISVNPDGRRRLTIL